MPSGAAVNIQGTTSLYGSTVVNGSLTANAGQTVTGDVLFNNRLSVASDVSLNSRVYIGQNLTLGSSATISLPAASLASNSINNYDLSSNGRFIETNTTTQTIGGAKTFNGRLYYPGGLDISYGTFNPPHATTFLGTSELATTTFVASAIQYLVGMAPTTLDTIYQISQSLSGDASAVYDLTNAISLKVNRSGDSMTGGLALGNVAIPGQYMFDVSGTAHISQTLVVDQDVSLNGNLNVVGNISIPNSDINTKTLHVIDLTTTGNNTTTGNITVNSGNIILSAGELIMNGAGGFIVQF